MPPPVEGIADMLALWSGLLRAGVGMKLNQIKLATRSYLRDRTNQATGSVTSYAVAAGLYAAAGIFLIAACLVGATALFRWIEINYGLFHAFGAIGALLVVIAAVCGGLAAAKLNRPPPQFPSLTSRLRVAIKANPIKPPDRIKPPNQVKPPDQIKAARDTATAILRAPSAPVTPGYRRRPRSRRNKRNMQAGFALAAMLLGWAATRRRQQAQRTEI